jgi:hypothetical protein
MKSIIKTTGKLLSVAVALFVYTCAARLMYAMYGDLDSSVVSIVYYVIVCLFLMFLTYVSSVLFYHELFKK